MGAKRGHELHKNRNEHLNARRFALPWCVSIPLLVAVAIFLLAACGSASGDPLLVTPNIVYITATEPGAAFEIIPLTATDPVPTPNVVFITATPPPSSTSLLAPTDQPASATAPVVLADTPAEVEFALPPVVQHVTKDTAWLFFELSAPSPGVVLYWPTDNPARQASAPLLPEVTRQQIVLEELEAGVEYQAIVALGPDSSGLYHQAMYWSQFWDPISFRAASEREPLRIGVLGDSGFGGQETFRLAAEMATYDLDFVIHTGDTVYNVDENPDPYEAFARKWYLPLAPLLRTMPIYPVVGNHDVEAATLWQGMPFYYHAFPPFADPLLGSSAYEGRNQWYAFAYGDVQFLMLDTQTFFGEGGYNAQQAWLNERLADSRFAYTVPVFHVAPYTSGRHVRDGEPIRMMWVPQFEAASVPLVLSGHDHNYERLIANGVTYVVSGGGSGTLYAQSRTLPESQVFARSTHFVLLEIYADRIELRAIALGGEELDRVTIPLP